MLFHVNHPYFIGLSALKLTVCVSITIVSFCSLNTTAQPLSEGAFRRLVWRILRSELLIFVEFVAPGPFTYIATFPFYALKEDVFQGIVAVRNTTTVETSCNVHDFLSPTVIPESVVLAAVSSVMSWRWENIRPPVSPCG